MKNILLIFFLFLCYNVVAQQRFPVGVPTQFSTGFFKQGYHQSDSGTIIANRDTNWLAKYSGTIVFKPSNKQFYWFDSTTLTWNQFGSTSDTTSLSNRINLKLNISDTADMLLPYLRKIDTTNKWVQDVYVRNDSLFKFKNGTETFLDTLGGGGGGPGTVTSVALSMPSAFSVSGSPITTSGTFNVSGAGTALQYIRGNGTLATTDTGMIPDFYSKARGLLSATSPITYNSTTGAIGIQNATASGTKGAATFVNSSFSDNGSGAIDLADVTGAGGCINCAVTFDTKGRAISYASGTPPEFVNAPGAGDTLSINDTLKRLNPGYGILHTVTTNNITQRVDTSAIATQFDLTLVNNGLSRRGDTTQLGALDNSSSPLNHDTYINTDVFRLIVGGANPSGNVLEGINTGTGAGVYGSSINSYGINGNSTDLYGVYGVSSISHAIHGWTTNGNTAGYLENNAASTNTVLPTLQLKRTTAGTAGAGIGSSIEWYVEKDNGANNTQSHTLRSILTTTTSGAEVGQFELYGVDNAVLGRKFALNGPGQWTWDGYPALTPQTDTTNIKPIGYNTSTGLIEPMANWVGSGGGSGTNNTNLGSAYRWLNEGTQTIKTVADGYGIVWDSTSTANTLTAKADTSVLVTPFDLTQISSIKRVSNIESLKAETGIIDSFIMVDNFGYFKHINTYETNGQYTIKANDGTYWFLVLNTNDNPYLNRKVNVYYNKRGIIIGNSISMSGGAVTTYPTYMSYVIGDGLSNNSIAGSTVINIGNMYRGDQIPINRAGYVVVNNGVNSIRFLKSELMKLDMLNMYRCFITNSFRRSTVDASSATQVTGTWAAWTGLTSTVVSKTNCMVTADSAATLRFTLNSVGQLYGAYVNFITNLYTDVNQWSDSVDIKDNLGNLLATVNVDRQSAHGKTPVCVFIPKERLGTTVTYIEVINRTNDTLIVDFAGSMKPNLLCEPVMIADITKVADYALQPGIGNDWWDEVNQAADSMIQEDFQRHGYPVTTLPLNDGFDPNDTTMIYNDGEGIHPSTLAHRTIFMKNIMKRINLVTFAKDTVITVPNAAAYTSSADVFSNPSRRRIFILPQISQNSTIQIVSETAPSGNGYTAYGQEQIFINQNSSASFKWSPLNWTLRDNTGATITQFQDQTIYHVVFETTGYRLINKYGTDNVVRDGDSIRITIDGKAFAVFAGSGVTTLNALTAATQTFATGTSGTDFNISSSSSTHTFNIPSASASNRGLVTTASQTIAGTKTFTSGIIVNNIGAGAGAQISGDRTAVAAPGIAGIALSVPSFTYTSSAGAGTETQGQNFNVFGSPTLTSSNAVTYTGNVVSALFAGAPIAGGSSTIDHPYNVYANDVSRFAALSMALNEQSGDATIGNASGVNIYTGAGGHTFTLPALSMHPGKIIFIKNAGGGNLTVARAGSDNIYDTSSVTSITVAAGASAKLMAGSSFWYVLN